jgi:hypothetical protein
MKIVLILFAAVLLTTTIWAQSPNKMSYQAIIRNNSNALITNTAVGMRISILQGSVSGNALYIETQTPTTNSNGLVSIEIGGGTNVTGVFTAINWENGPYFIKIETDPNGGTSYSIIGISQLLSVPYALHAKTAETITGGITETDPLWTSSPSFGITNINISNWNTAFGWGDHSGLYRPISYVPAWNDITNKPTTISGYGITDAFSGNYNDLTNKPILFDGQYNSLTGLPSLFSGSFNDLTNKPTTISGYGIIDAFSGNYNDLNNKPILFSGSYIDLTNKPINIDENNTDDVTLTGTQTISGNKSYSGLNTFYDNSFFLRNATGTFATNLRSSASNARTITFPDVTGTAITSGNLTDITSLGTINSGIWNATAIAPTYGGLGINTSSTLSGSLLYTSSTGTWATLAPGSNGQVLKLVGGTPTWGADNSGSGTVTSITAGTGLTGGTITTIGTLELTGQALALHNLSTNGLIARTTTGTVEARKITAGTGIAISNGDGISGNPTISISKPKFYLGQDTLGGIVFYIYLGADGQQHGLIVSKTETTAQWQSTTSTTNAIRSWDGLYNMGLMNNSPAKNWITANFSSDWYLPSMDELNILWQNRFHANKVLNIGSFTLLSNTARYWSSTEGDASGAWDFTFGDGNVGNFSKINTHRVRAVRAF